MIPILSRMAVSMDEVGVRAPRQTSSPVSAKTQYMLENGLYPRQLLDEPVV